MLKHLIIMFKSHSAARKIKLFFALHEKFAKLLRLIFDNQNQIHHDRLKIFLL